ncbi:GAF and ANTAR domain-containing protein [Terracoccus sp. 273MFTsu3.1]|uniref:GAF and ANTAR domain-containing protein n=1 Tax=Terracoccus sp. 273MFTsu3.1 TaxID=1172188 RepID=UPI0003715ECE|nr:GAF and ANTAR domain-containing protein [Terracoccus sp. 273MFTsu3.1]
MARVLLQLAEEPLPAGADGLVSTLTRLCAALVRHLPAAGSGISLMGEGHGSAGVAAAAGPRSRRLEELQFTVGEGPCLDAHAARRPMLEPDLAGAGSDRWPIYGPRAAALGVRAVFAFPLQVGSVRVGVLDIYRQQAGPLSPEALASGYTFAEVALRLLLQEQAGASEGRTPEGLDDALAYRMEVYQAQGMVMVDLGVRPDEALARLRGHAFATGQDITAVAREIVDGSLRLTRDHPPLVPEDPA